MGGLSAAHWAVIALAFIVLFGYKRLPDASRSIGRSLRIFKAETKGLRHDDDAPGTPTPAAVAGAPVANVVQTPVPPVVVPDDQPSPLPVRDRA